jgi:hypothetical protein
VKREKIETQGSRKEQEKRKEEKGKVKIGFYYYSR